MLNKKETNPDTHLEVAENHLVEQRRDGIEHPNIDPVWHQQQDIAGVFHQSETNISPVFILLDKNK